MSPLLSLFFSVLLVRQAFVARKQLAHTTAVSSANWTIVAGIALTLLAALWCFDAAPPRILSGLQYAASVFLLVPLLDLLGARRPTHRAWPWFVLLPMFVVLQWPSISQCLSASSFATPVEVPTPTFLGFLLVIVMGCGNHFGTHQTLSIFLVATGIASAAIPTSEWMSYTPHGLTLASGLCLAATFFVRQPHLIITPDSNSPELAGDQLLWADFRDIYGMVWARRAMDRVNQFADRERWPVRMTLDGFRTNSGELVEAHEPAVSRLCWVLRRFLNDEFMQRYVKLQSQHSSEKPAR